MMMVRSYHIWVTAALLLEVFANVSIQGLSPLGMLPSRTFPKFLNSSITNQTPPWKSGVDTGGIFQKSPTVRTYHFNVSRAFISPDGYNKSSILINGQFPGPAIEANWGETISVKVTNSLFEMEEGLTVHWHGFRQKDTPWFDGVPGVSQCPIAPGSSFEYVFTADQYGTSWYHSHFSGQYTDGFFGPIIIYGPSHVEYDIDLGPVILSDYIHDNYYDVTRAVFEIPPKFPNVDNNLINGKATVICNATTSNCPESPKFNLKAGKIHKLRLINSGGLANQKFSVDGHQLTVVATDFVPIVPYSTSVVTLGVGQRLDVLLTANGAPKDSTWMRSEIDLDCLNTTFTTSVALAAMYYPQADERTLPSTRGSGWTSNNCKDDDIRLTTPFYPQRPGNPAVSEDMVITLRVNASGNLLIDVDGSPFRANYNVPTLLLASQGKQLDTSEGEMNIHNYGSNHSVRLVWQNTYAQQHPLHLHGHNFWVLAQGTGVWNGSIINPSNPLRRDTFILGPGSPEEPAYAVLQWEQDNPGIWPFHCHDSLHVSGGLYINVVERPEDIRRDMEVPKFIAQTCNDWARFTSGNFVDQIDSGV